TQNPERGRKLHIDFLDLARREDHVVRPKTPREDGNSSTIASMSMSQSSSRQTQNPERGRKHIPRVTAGAHHSSSRQTQNPERGRKLHHASCHQSASSSSSDPKPREGTETRRRAAAYRATDTPGRQTQNPERGRKLVIASRRAWRADCRQTQNPERGRKHHPTQAPKSMTSRRQTQNPERGRKRGWWASWRWGLSQVVRPKTPRGDGNYTTRRAISQRPPRRQTQNPERGRKHSESHVLTADSHVVRPKTPRGDGNRAAFDTRSS
ncbi:hypothetical protein AO97_04069, partial [Mycobacterium tuberculosis M2198]